MKITGPNLPGVRLSPDLQRTFKKELTNKAENSSFGDMLKQKIDQVDELQKKADTEMVSFATGKTKNIHEAVLAMEMADTSLRMAVTVRNKVIEAYQEIMRMPV